MTRALVVLSLFAAVSDAHAFAAPEGDVEAAPYVSAYLIYPSNGAGNVPGNTLVFAMDVTAMQLEGPAGETIACLLDPSPSATGAVFEPMQLLGPGAHRVLGIPSELADNYAGPGITIDLGTFTVGDVADEDAPPVQIVSATWLVEPESESLSLDVDIDADFTVDPPVQFEIDVGDADTLLDGTADLASAWVRATFFNVPIGDSLPQVQAESATVRVRALDAAGNVGPWSAPSSVAIQYANIRSSGCSAAPGRTRAAGGAALVLLLSLLAMAARRRRGR